MWLSSDVLARNNDSIVNVLMILSASLSTGSCIWILLALKKLHPRYRNRLFPRQLWHLTFADLLISTGALIYCPLRVFLPVWPPELSSWVCGICGFLLISGKLTTQFIEFHMAINFLAAFSRWKAVAFILQRTLFLPWLVGIILSVLVSASNPYHPSGNTPCCPGLAIWWEAMFGAMIFILTSLVYVCACWRAFGYPRAVKRRATHMAFWYPVNFFLSFGPMWMYFFSREGWGLAKVSLALSGFGNAVVYSCNSKYVTMERDDTNNCTDSEDLARWAGLASFRVGFERQAQVLEFSERRSET
uniref:G-protein coupled receptors family 1 profile domain-containing protein n=1 Tax=Noctiluca scintillans TaxID=2966 RepID=A0A7S1AE23_NOCSC|mmetsp:Transcript_42487/g.112098  ORF Transcript_42487/g.112098 Transcript_42487/m.112098 type:complete len:302 (+) Transcript_42487:144-1049(+)